MTNKTIIKWALILVLPVCAAAYFFSQWSERYLLEQLGTYEIAGQEVQLGGFQLKYVNGSGPNGVAIFQVNADSPFGFDDFPKHEACNAILARPPDLRITKGVDFENMMISLVEQSRKALVISYTKQSSVVFQIEDGTCVPLTEGDNA